ncbi:hypothetical protein A4A49_54344 [Nicotiana attenuata]|uniref:DUF4283 domain-containing protein n=1 Tax=Nicotiana attenuata TaxID=49451 RepID=A0A1J6IX45_NICAT|nr:hypothetical protein A4A49_54344 [Nicotiana attenuata]
MSAVLFKASDYYGIMAAECTLTIVGRFLKPRPLIDRIRSKFKELISMKGSAKIGIYDNFNVFLDFTNEDDFNMVLYRRVIEIEGQQMWLQKWSPDFKPEEDLPVAPVWVLLPGLRFHMHTWQYVKQVVSSIGTPLEMDLATKGRTRSSMAKVRIEIDLLKQQSETVYVGQIYEDAPQKGIAIVIKSQESNNEQEDDNKEESFGAHKNNEAGPTHDNINKHQHGYKEMDNTINNNSDEVVQESTNIQDAKKQEAPN